jgi:hypothetical protein
MQSKRGEMVLAGSSRAQIFDSIKALEKMPLLRRAGQPT